MQFVFDNLLKLIFFIVKYFNIYHILLYKHGDFLFHYADKVHLLIKKEKFLIKLKLTISFKFLLYKINIR
jgi:hypothetical protein